MILGTLLIAGGAILIAMFGIVPEPTRSLDDLLELFRRPAFVLYFSILGVVVFGCLIIVCFIVDDFLWMYGFTMQLLDALCRLLFIAKVDSTSLSDVFGSTFCHSHDIPKTFLYLHRHCVRVDCS